LAKSQKQENAYSEAIDQMQREVDELQEECTKLKTAAANAPDRPGESGIPYHPRRRSFQCAFSAMPGVLPAEGVETLHHEGNLETSYLLEQVCLRQVSSQASNRPYLKIEALRGTVRFLRSENSYLKGQDLIRSLQTLPPLPDLVPTTEDSSEDGSEVDEDDFSIPKLPNVTPKSIRALDTASKVLHRDLLTFSSSPRVVDISPFNSRPLSVKLPNGIADQRPYSSKSRGWLPQKDLPQHQLWQRSLEAAKLHERLQGLSERTILVAQTCHPRSRTVSKLI
jgi:dynactin 1